MFHGNTMAKIRSNGRGWERVRRHLRGVTSPRDRSNKPAVAVSEENMSPDVSELIELSQGEARVLREKIAVFADLQRDPLDVARARVEFLQFVAVSLLTV